MTSKILYGSTLISSSTNLYLADDDDLTNGPLNSPTLKLAEPVDVRNVNRRFDKFINRSKLPKIRFHDMRHTHATLMLKMGAHPKVVSERLGHGTIELTLNTYIHLLPNMQFEAVQNFNKNMEKIKNIYSI